METNVHEVSLVVHGHISGINVQGKGDSRRYFLEVSLFGSSYEVQGFFEWYGHLPPSNGCFRDVPTTAEIFREWLADSNRADGVVLKITLPPWGKGSVRYTVLDMVPIASLRQHTTQPTKEERFHRKTPRL